MRAGFNLFRFFVLIGLSIASQSLFGQQLAVDAGPDASLCTGGASSAIGGGPTASGGTAPYTYSWSPADGLSDPTIPNPIASPTVTTTYTITVTDNAGATLSDEVTVGLYPPPVVDAGTDVTINEGERITLNASGGVSYFWWPPYRIRYANTGTPDVEPIVTTTYYVGIIDANGCVSYDSVTVNVTPNDDLYFYNTFTPNNDGENDRWYIGNISKYPDNRLEIYNRYGKMVFVAAPYLNHWDGRNFGEELPTGTYYYIFDPGNGDKPVKGSVTILR